MAEPVARAQAWSTGDATGAAAAYERTRPDYPIAAVRWVLAGSRRPVRRVLDLGAGTGKLTRTLVDLGLDTVAVDPSGQMLDVLARSLPSAQPLAGTAEELPLPDAGVDAVLCGQAWHWMDPERAAGEVARVLRPGGVLGLLWNLRDERTPWVAAFSEALDNHEDVDFLAAAREKPPDLGSFFESPEYQVTEYTHALAPADLQALALSRSHVLTREPADRERILRRVAELARTHPDLAGRTIVGVPYTTVTWRARLRDRPGAAAV